MYQYYRMESIRIIKSSCSMSGGITQDIQMLYFTKQQTFMMYVYLTPPWKKNITNISLKNWQIIQHVTQFFIFSLILLLFVNQRFQWNTDKLQLILEYLNITILYRKFSRMETNTLNLGWIYNYSPANLDAICMRMECIMFLHGIAI